MTTAPPLPSKQDVARALLLKGSMFLHLDPRVDGVVVPPWLKRQPQLVLQVGLDMAVPIPDLRVDEHGVYGTLTFNRTAFTCSVPWSALFALGGDDGRGMVWPESMPKEIAAEVEREAKKARMGVDGNAIELGERPARKRRALEPEAKSEATEEPQRERSSTPSLQLIAGSGERREALRTPERRGFPPYLRRVK